jgi:hypothetical protein
MDVRRFDSLTKGLAIGASRRRVLAGLGGVAALALGRAVPMAAQEEGAALCMQTCTTQAQTCREGCAGLKSRAKNACLKTCKAQFAGCREACVPPDDTDGGTPE